MYSARLYPLLLTVVGISVAAARVEPPTNVTLHCGNRKNILEWKYANLSSTQGLRFRVDIGTISNSEGLPNVIWVDSPHLQADLSFLSNPNQEYFITVTATIGSEESEPSPEDGIEFSYFQDSLVHQKCFLDFPSVAFIAKPNKELQLRFEHPWAVYYKESSDVKGSAELPSFKYYIDIVNQSEDHTFTCEEKVCEETVAVNHAQEKYCVTVSGELEKVLVKGKEEYCVQHPSNVPPSNMYIYIFIGVLVAVVSALLGYMMYHRVTNPDTPLPRFMTFQNPSNGTLCPQREQALENGTVLEVEPRSPVPLLTVTPEENSSRIPFSDDDGRMRIGVPSEDEGVSDVGVQQPNEYPEYMQGNDLEDDNALPSTGYERREVLVSIDSIEQTKGYRG